jgi:thioesterase domain-containing protein
MDIFGALLNGATLAPRALRTRGTVDLAGWIDACGITLLHTVPALFRHMLEGRDAEPPLPRVRAIDLGGEPVFPSDLRLWRRHFTAECSLVNHLAATEASVIAQHVIQRDREYATETIPVGRAAPGVEIAIVREDGSDAAPGEVGEILVHSPFLSPGYWQRPDLTRAAFADDARRPGWRTYRSGDLGRFDAQGLLVAVGRRDDRVKIRGHSVHLAEVEAGVRALPGVRDAVVVAGAGARLSAYLVAPGRRDTELRAALATRLPEHMLPAEWVLLDRLPLSPNGKIDRQALSAPGRPTATPAGAFTFPGDALELALRAIWEKVLDRNPLGTHDDFFAQGGSSLLAMSLYAEIRRTLGVELPIDTLVRFPTIHRLAQALRERGWKASRSLLVPLRSGGAKPPLFMIHGLEGAVLPFVFVAGHVAPERPVFGVQAPRSDVLVDPAVTFEHLAATYAGELRATHREGPYHLAGYCSGGLLAFEVARQLERQGQRVGLVSLLDPLVLVPGFLRVIGAVHLSFLARGWFDSAPLQRVRGVARRLRPGILERRRRSGHHAFPPLSAEAARVMLALGRKRPAYRPGPFSGGVQLILADAYRAHEGSARSRWAAVARGGVEVQWVPGNHFSMLGKPIAPLVAEHMLKAIAAIEGADPR